MTRVHKSRVNVENASISTKYRKAKEVQNLREMSVGSGKETVVTQLENEVKRVDKETKKRLVSAAGGKRKVILDNETVSDMKVACGLSYSQLREMRSYLKTQGVYLPAEGKQRSRERDLTLGSY